MNALKLVILSVEKHGPTHLVMLGNAAGEVVDGIVVPEAVAAAFAKLLN